MVYSQMKYVYHLSSIFDENIDFIESYFLRYGKLVFYIEACESGSMFEVIEQNLYSYSMI